MIGQDQQEKKKVPTPLQDLVNETQKDSTTGPLIGSLIVIILLILGGLYFLGSLIKQKSVQNQEKETFEIIQNEKILEEVTQQSESEEIELIEADLKATNFDILDQAIEDIEKEF